MIDWPAVTLALGVLAFVTAMRWLQMSARKITYVDELESRIAKLEKNLYALEAPVPVMPRGLPSRLR